VTQAPDLDARRTPAAERSGSGDGRWRPIEVLYQVKAPDRLARRLSARWPGLPSSEVEATVGQALDELYGAMQRGRFVRDPRRLLWTIATRRASNSWERTVHAVPHAPAALSKWAATVAVREDPEAVERRAAALTSARRLLPTIGDGSIVPVMAMVFELVEAGNEPRPEQVATALHLNPGTVKTLMRRGFQRLTARARTEASTLPPRVLAASRPPSTSTPRARRSEGRTQAVPHATVGFRVRGGGGPSTTTRHAVFRARDLSLGRGTE
jgi:DNA-directed RNA polymerase specialized sigma24 family protein